MVRPQYLKTKIAEGAATTSGGKADRQLVTALVRGLEILRCFSVNRTELSGMEIANLTGLPQPTVWRLTYTLSQLGYLDRSDDKMRIGPSVLALGYSALATSDIGEIAQEGMQRLANDFNAASSLAAPDSLDMLIVRRATSIDSILVVNLHVGSRLDMAASSFGWAYLASLSENARSLLLSELADRKGRGWSKWLKGIVGAVSMYERRGYILNCGTYHRHINAIAVPINPGAGAQTLVLNLGSPATQITAERLEKEVAPRIMDLASTLRRRLDASR